MWRSLGEEAGSFLTRSFNSVIESDSMPGELRRSVLVAIVKNKGAESCSSYRGMELISRITGIWSRVLEASLKSELRNTEQQKEQHTCNV